MASWFDKLTTSGGNPFSAHPELVEGRERAPELRSLIWFDRLTMSGVCILDPISE